MPAGPAENAAGDGSVGWLTAVDSVTLQVPAGQILALLGPNGAGKTTTVRMLAAILRPSDGWARVAGLDTVREARRVRQAVGLLTEFPGLYLRMRADEYLGFFGQLQGLAEDQIRRRVDSLMERFGLAGQRRQRLAEYSKGMRQKLALIRAMLHDPPLLLLDEPTSAMDPHSAKLVHDAILNLREERRTILLCTHNLAEAEMLADRIAIIRHGQIVALDTPEQLKSQMLGPPLLELRLAHPVDGVVREGLAQLDIQVEAWGDTWFRYRTPSPGTTNPEIVVRLAAMGAQVVTLSELPRSLEEVYLRIVGDTHGR
ncbi:MAG: ABC transporter ATP-binding protein [Anaerolineae bacterium]|nr:ABC transporter ATP-binding protein [Anaerolineae bacterium]